MKRIIALSLFVLLGIALWTNPSKEQQQAAVKQKASAMINERLGKTEKEYFNIGMQLFGKNVIDEFVQNSVIIDNYYLFSLIKIKWQGKEYPIGGGAFKKVWISDKVDEKADEIVNALKNYY